MKNKCIIFLFCHSMLLLTACTGGFENDNEIKGGFSDDKKEIDFQNLTAPFEPIQSGIYFNIGSVGLNWVWQMTQSLNHDMFSGYFMDPIPKCLIQRLLQPELRLDQCCMAMYLRICLHGSAEGRKELLWQ